MASPGAPTGLAAPRGVGGTQPRGLGPRGAPEGGAVGRLDAWGLRRGRGGGCDMPCVGKSGLVPELELRASTDECAYQKRFLLPQPRKKGHLVPTSMRKTPTRRRRGA